MEFLSLEDAVARHVRPGDAVHVVMGHSRWTAAARELIRQHWGSDAGFDIVMFSLSSLGALFVQGGMVRRFVTGYAGDSFPTYSPNPVFQRAFATGEVEFEQWSFLSLQQRLEAGARGAAAAVTTSLHGSSMASNAAYHEVHWPLGMVSLVEALVPDVTLVHAAVADREGNVAMEPPLLEGVAGVFAAERGAVVTVERVVDDLRPWSHLVRIPAHRVLAVVEAPFGAHPGGLHAPNLPVEAYGEDIPFLIDARDAARGDLDAWAREWVLDVPTHDDYLTRLGAERLDRLRARADPMSWQRDALEHPVDETSPVTPWEVAATLAAREVEERVSRSPLDAVLAGAGVANLAAWVGVTRARAAGASARLTAELGLWDYAPTGADPTIFNLRSYPSAAMLTDMPQVLGTFVGGPGTRVLGCVGTAEVDRVGNLNSTVATGGGLLVGSGGANDVLSRAEEVVVVTLLRPERTPDQVGYVTGPGTHVTTVVTDRGVLRKRHGVLRLNAVPEGDEPLATRVRAAVESCGWELEVEREVAELPAPRHDEVLALRHHDRLRWFLG